MTGLLRSLFAQAGHIWCFTFHRHMWRARPGLLLNRDCHPAHDVVQCGCGRIWVR